MAGDEIIKYKQLLHSDTDGSADFTDKKLHVKAPDLEIIFGSPTASPQTDPNAASASYTELFRGLMTLVTGAATEATIAAVKAIFDDVHDAGNHVLKTSASLSIGNNIAVTNSNLDIALTVLRDSITKTGATSKTLADIVAALALIPITINGRTVQNAYTFHNSRTSQNDGTATKLSLNGANRVIVDIIRTSITANVITFKKTGPGGNVAFALGAKMNSDGSVSTGVSSSATINESWEFDDLAGFTDIYFPIDSMTGTSITVIGKAVGG